MKKQFSDKVILMLSLSLGLLIVFASCVGLFTPNFYAAETANWQAQSIGQDLVDLLLIAPCLLVTSVLASRNNRVATSIWGGTVLYVIYTFTLYCFTVHFNQLFIVYCLCLGLSFYAFIYFLFRHANEKAGYSNRLTGRMIGIYFIILSALFYLLWLSEIIPSISNGQIPKSVAEAGLFTNGVQVLDLAVILPAIFVSGIFIFKGRSLGIVLAPVILTFFILMDITIGTLVVVMKSSGIDSDLSLTGIMGALAILSLYFLINHFKGVQSRYVH